MIFIYNINKDDLIQLIKNHFNVNRNTVLCHNNKSHRMCILSYRLALSKRINSQYYKIIKIVSFRTSIHSYHRYY